MLLLNFLKSGKVSSTLLSSWHNVFHVTEDIFFSCMLMQLFFSEQNSFEYPVYFMPVSHIALYTFALV